ncbi:hypothetical protein BJ170DRAFT_630284 [Xylariales sp. AK1849]|nr:hypothetical protein BJ170DRAFT_630284 [Xylariales sp. AK1849]
MIRLVTLLSAGNFLSSARSLLVPQQKISFSSLVVFGDSYTDQGVYSYTPDSNGTVGTPKAVTHTGGRAWPQYVGQYSGANIYDYAVSGADCDSTFAPSKRNGIKQDQLPAFLADNAYVSNSTGKSALYNPSDETVYAVWIGTNDIGSEGFLTEVQPKGMPLTDYNDCVFEQLDRVYAVGARNFVLMNLAPLDLTPQYALPENGGVDSSRFWVNKTQYNANITQSSEKMRQYTTLANAVYRFQVPYEVKIAGRYPGSLLAVFDVYSLLSDIWNNPSKYLNGTVPLNVTGYITDCANDTCASSSARDSYLWYDELHPSEQTDRVIAREFMNVVGGQSNWTTYWSDI